MYLKVLYCLPMYFCGNALAQSDKANWLNELNNIIQQSARFDAQKLRRIDSLHKLDSKNYGNQFDHCLKLYDEYTAFNFDSAYYYATRLAAIASASKDSSLIKYASIKLNLMLLSSGMFKEVFDSLGTLTPHGLSNEGKAEYYILKARSYFDLADYNHDKTYSRQYSSQASAFIDSLLLVVPENSFQFNYYQGLKAIRTGDVHKATRYFRPLTTWQGLTLHQQAIANSTFSDIYIRKKQFDSAIVLLAKAGIADIRSSTKETVAIFNLANLLFSQGDIKNASVFIQKAANDAKAYGARQRMVQLSAVLPLIEAERLAAVEREKSSIKAYAFIITLLFVFLIALMAIVIGQVRKMKRQQKEINQKNASLHHLVEEKEWLLKEIHHRVKNNLHIINSLLESQSAYLANDALNAIQNSQRRVFAMSLIHQKLYNPDNDVTNIDMPIYLHELVNYLKESFQTGKRIRFEMQLEPISLDISLAIPLGLILNEAITNALKYAFPAQMPGIITISIIKTEADHFELSVTDNGVGLPTGFGVENINSLGMKLMKGLSEDIAASFNFESSKGTRIFVEFTMNKSLKHLQNTARA